MSFPEEEKVQASAPAVQLADALFGIFEAKNALDQAIKNVPQYTAQYDDEHFYAREQGQYNQAVNSYAAAAVEAVVADKEFA